MILTQDNEVLNRLLRKEMEGYKLQRMEQHRQGDCQGTASQDKPPPAPANRSVHSCTMPSSGTAEPELTLGQPVSVFSRSADKWLKGRVVRLTDKTVRVEYEIGDKKCGKELDRQSEHLMITVMKYAPSLAEYDRT